MSTGAGRADAGSAAGVMLKLLVQVSVVQEMVVLVLSKATCVRVHVCRASAGGVGVSGMRNKAKRVGMRRISRAQKPSLRRQVVGSTLAVVHGRTESQPNVGSTLAVVHVTSFDPPADHLKVKGTVSMSGHARVERLDFRLLFRDPPRPLPVEWWNGRMWK